MSFQKPYHSMERGLEYQKHLRRIDLILNNHKMRDCHWAQRPSVPASTRGTYNSSNCRRISEQNERLANRIIDISRRKSSIHSVVSLPKKLPAWKTQKQRKITLENSQLAERLMSKQSEFSRVKMIKQVQKYERIKKSMLHNRRIQLQYSTQNTLEPMTIDVV